MGSSVADPPRRPDREEEQRAVENEDEVLLGAVGILIYRVAGQGT